MNLNEKNYTKGQKGFTKVGTHRSQKMVIKLTPKQKQTIFNHCKKKETQVSDYVRGLIVQDMSK